MIRTTPMGAFLLVQSDSGHYTIRPRGDTWASRADALAACAALADGIAYRNLHFATDPAGKADFVARLVDRMTATGELYSTPEGLCFAPRVVT